VPFSLELDRLTPVGINDAGEIERGITAQIRVVGSDNKTLR
jgi:hypothetical protein